MKRQPKMTAYERRNKLLNDASYRKEIFKGLVNHLKQGYSINCYELLSSITISKYIEQFPEEFVLEELESAIRAGQQGWESIGRRQAEGQCIGNSRAWSFTMGARYGWSDRSTVAVEHSGAVPVQVISYATPIPATEQASTPVS